MLKRGDRQHDIAAWFGVNAGRVAEVANGTSYSNVDAADLDALPPVGPYPSGKVATAAIEALPAAKQAVAAAERVILSDKR